MADTSNEINKQNEMLDAQLSIVEALSRLAQQRVVFEGETSDEISNINDTLREQLNIANKQKDGLLKNLSQQKELNKVNNQSLGIARSLQSITASELGTQKLLDKIANDRVKLTKNINFLQKQAQQTFSSDVKLNQAIQDSILAQVNAFNKLNKELSKAENVSKAIANDGFLSIFNTLKDIIRVIPGLNKIIPGFDQAAQGYREALTTGGGSKEEIQRRNELLSGIGKGKGFDQEFISQLPEEMQVQLVSKDGEPLTGAAAAAKAKKLGLALKTPIQAAMTALQGFMKKFILLEFVLTILKADKVTGDLAKSFNVTYQEATQIQSKLTQIANTNSSVALTSKKIAETQLFINKLYGTTSMATEEQLVTMTKLRELSGFTNEELAGILAISTSTGKEMEQITGEVTAQAKFTSLKYGVSLNEREVAKDISKISAATTLSLGKNPKSLAEAVATAKSLGMELSKVESIALSMLQFESSIENELSAELLIGKELNLERARFAAINNDVATLASEIASQMGSAANFGEMSAIQQEALAKAVGMNREELARTLYIQEQLAGLTGEDAKKKEQILNKRIAEVGLAQAQQEIAKDGYDTLENQASVQERILLATEKLSELFAFMAPTILMAADALMTIIAPITLIVELIQWIGKGFENAFSYIGKMIPALGVVGRIMKGIASLAVVFAAHQVFGAMTKTAGPLGVIAGIAAAATIMSVGMGAINGLSTSVNDAIINPDGDIITTHPDDYLIATKDPQGLANSVGGSGGSSAKVESLLEQLVKKNSNWYLDSSKVDEAKSFSYSKL
jgi:hypothetical protein